MQPVAHWYLDHAAASESLPKADPDPDGPPGCRKKLLPAAMPATAFRAATTLRSAANFESATAAEPLLNSTHPCCQSELDSSSKTRGRSAVPPQRCQPPLPFAEPAPPVPASTTRTCPGAPAHARSACHAPARRTAPAT